MNKSDDKKLTEKKLTLKQSIDEMLNEVPNVKDKTLETWRKLGALNISDNKGDSKCLFEIEDGQDFYGAEFSTYYG